MGITYVIIISAFAFLVLLWAAVGIRHLLNLRKLLVDSWEFVDEKNRKRHDVLPLMVEIERASFGGDAAFNALVEELIVKRDQARRIYFASPEKTLAEKSLLECILKLLEMGGKDQKISRNNYFLEIQSEIKNLNSDIENRTREFLITVDRYNKAISGTLLKPLALILKLQEKKT